MTDADPIEELADTLYDALYAITPYAEAHFADQPEGLKTAVRSVLDEAAGQQWIQKQLEQTGIRAMDFRNGMHMELESARELLAHQVAAARAMLGDAPNYTETKLEWDVKVAESPEMYTIVIQRHAPGTLTPHEARQKAEAQHADLAEISRSALEVLDDLMRDHPDPGSNAYGVTYLLRQHLYNVPEPGQRLPEADTRLAAVLAECDALEAEVHGQHDEDDDGIREAVQRIRARAQEAVHG